jgi:predicted enzyme related to lactoylglutathione lyase
MDNLGGSLMPILSLGTAIQFCVDLEVSQKWYTDFLGKEPTPYDAPLYTFGDNAAVMLAPGAPGTGRGGTGLYFAVEDVVTTYNELKGRGYVFNEEPWDSPAGKVVTLMDPDGNIIGIADNSHGGLRGG